MVLPVHSVQFSRNQSEIDQSHRKKSVKEDNLQKRLEKALVEPRSTSLKKSSTVKLNRSSNKSEVLLDVYTNYQRNQPKLERLLTHNEQSTAIGLS